MNGFRRLPLFLCGSLVVSCFSSYKIFSQILTFQKRFLKFKCNISHKGKKGMPYDKKGHHMIEYSIVSNWNTSKVVAPNNLETDFLRRFFQENVLFRFLVLLQLQIDCSEQLFPTEITSPRVFSSKFSKCFRNFYMP